ncbi:MAG: amidase [Pseudomonadota bacterium]
MTLSATALAAAFRSGRDTPRAAVDRVADTIAVREGRLGAFQTLHLDEARAAADAHTALLGAGHDLGPLQGVPIALKDLVDLEGRETTWGSAMLAGRIAPATGTLARRLIGAGAVLVGKTKTVECAFGGWGTNTVLGTPRNPHDDTVHRVPGGSSSGSGVAVAAGMAALAVGTDTGGSVRLPAAFCGIVGLKVSEGQLPLDGIMPLSHTLDTPGPMAPSVRDAALMFEVMRGTDPGTLARALTAPTGPFAALEAGVTGLTLGRLHDPAMAEVEAPVMALYDAAVATLERAGARIVDLTPPDPWPSLRDRNGLIIAAEAWTHHGARFADPGRPADDDVRTRILAGRDIDAADYIATLLDRRRAAADWAGATAGIDAVLTPTTACLAPPVDTVDQTVSPGSFTRPGNYLGLSALALPCGSAGGLPAGLQIVTPPNGEWTALRIGRTVERALA